MNTLLKNWSPVAIFIASLFVIGIIVVIGLAAGGVFSSPPSTTSESTSSTSTTSESTPASTTSESTTSESTTSASTPVTTPVPSQPFTVTFADVTGVTNSNGVDRVLALSSPLIPGNYSKFYVTYNGLDQNFGNANLIATIGIRDSVTKTVKTSWSAAWKVENRNNGAGATFSKTVDVPGGLQITSTDEAYVKFTEMYGGYVANIRNGSITLS
jgi:hypothetical protein